MVRMAVHGEGLGTLAEALSDQGFCMCDEFGVFVTYERPNDSVKVHVGPDGSFAAFDSHDEVIAEGHGAQDLYSLLVVKTVVPRAPGAPPRNPY
jgi:hypothetical protein